MRLYISIHEPSLFVGVFVEVIEIGCRHTAGHLFVVDIARTVVLSATVTRRLPTDLSTADAVEIQRRARTVSGVDVERAEAASRKLTLGLVQTPVKAPLKQQSRMPGS